MRPFLLLSTLIASTNAIAAAPTFQGNVYSASCDVQAPLWDEDYCTPWSWEGRQAADCAEQKVEILCRNNFNADCIHQEPTVQEVMSDTLIGYKACRATATARGYRQN